MNPVPTPFAIYPVLNLRKGQVVGLRGGDPAQQTVYDAHPAAVARRWVDAGATWLHLVNLDAVFGTDDRATQEALKEVLKVTKVAGVRTQLGGGLRSLEQIGRVLSIGHKRAVLSTVAVRQPFVLAAALDKWGPERIAVSLDARGGQVTVEGWTQETGRDALSLARWFDNMGLGWLVYTDISRDGTDQGADLAGTQAFTRVTRLNVIASGGVNTLEEATAAREAGLAGIAVGRALLEGRIDPRELFALSGEKSIG